MSSSLRYPVSHVLIPLEAAARDAEIAGGSCKLREPGNNGRKIAAVSLMPAKGEAPIESPRWQAGMVLVTGQGGFEISTFSEWSSQDRHRHEQATEIYTVLRGAMEIYIDDQGPYRLSAGDEVIILPGTVHEVVEGPRQAEVPSADLRLLVRVHALNCGGPADKFVQLSPGGPWQRWDQLAPQERAKAWRRR